jgi:hypothetical protein
MVEILEIPWFCDKKRILRNIRTKAKGCGFPGCWILRDPVKTNEKIWLRPKDIDRKKGVRASVRRVLYHLNYKTLPLKPITMICKNDRCINPAHMRISGWESEANEYIEEQIEKGWLYPEDAEKWFGWENKDNIKQPEAHQFSANIEDAI